MRELTIEEKIKGYEYALDMVSYKCPYICNHLHNWLEDNFKFSCDLHDYDIEVQKIFTELKDHEPIGRDITVSAWWYEEDLESRKKVLKEIITDLKKK